MVAERYEYHSDRSHKFWDVEVMGDEVVVHYGRIGTNGTEHVSTCANSTLANNYMQMKIREKVSKGYVLMGWKPVAEPKKKTKPKRKPKVETNELILEDLILD